MVDANGITQNIKLFSENNFAVGDGANRFTGRRALIDTTVKFSSRFSVVHALYAEGRSYATIDRRRERVLPEAVVGNFVAEGSEQLNFFRRGAERFDVRAEADIFGGKTGGADEEFSRCEGRSFFEKKFDGSGSGRIFYGNRHQAERCSVGLAEKFYRAVVPFRRSGFRGTGEAQRLAEIDRLRRNRALLSLRFERAEKEGGDEN